LEQCAVICVRAGTRDERPLAPRHAAELWRVGRALDAEFLQRVDRHQTVRATLRAETRRASGALHSQLRADGERDVRADAIHQEVVRVRALTVDAELARTRRGR